MYGLGAPDALGPAAKLVARYGLLGYERRIARRFARIAYVSAGLAQHYASAFPGAPTVLYSPVLAVPPHACRPAGGRPIVLFVGKPSAGKGYGDFVAASSLVTDNGRNPVARFVHVGPPVESQHPAVNRWVESVGAGDAAFVESWRCQAALCVVPSRQADALPRTALEAVAHGVPVIGTRVGGIPEAVGGGGEIVEAGNPMALARAIIANLDAPRLSTNIRAAHASVFSLEAVAKAHESLYAETLG